MSPNVSERSHLSRLRALVSRGRRTRRIYRELAPYVHPVRAFVAARVAPRRRILCRRAPSRKSVARKIFAVNRYRVVLSPKRACDIAFGSGAVGTRADRTLNGGHRGNLKTTVQETWERVAGYALAVDPTRYTGPMVEKSDANATHDGCVVQGPIEAPRGGYVYQRLIDNVDMSVDRTRSAVDLRTPLYGGRVPLVYVKHRPLADRFSNTNDSVEVRDPHTVFSEAELDLLERFARAMGLDYGEVDVLRDNSDGRIYVVDSTQDPNGPPNALTPGDARDAVYRLARAFNDLIDDVVSGEIQLSTTEVTAGG